MEASCSKISFPTNNAHQVAHNSPKGDNPTHAHRGEAPPINQPTNLRQSLRLRPPKTKSPPAGHPLFDYTDCQQRPPGHLPESASAAASAPCTRPQIFNQRPDRFTAVYYDQQPSTRTRRTRWWPFRLNIRRRKHCYCCCRHSTSVLLISIHPHSHLSITITPRLSVVEEGSRRIKSGYRHTEKSHPTNWPTLQSAGRRLL